MAESCGTEYHPYNPLASEHFSGAFFKAGQTPQTDTGQTDTGISYFNFSILDDTSVHKYKNLRV